MKARWILGAATMVGVFFRATPCHPIGWTTESFILPNGMTFVVVQRPELATVAAGWVVRAGSADDTPGSTGMAHSVEHAMFNGSRTIGTRDAAAEAPLLAEEDTLRAALSRTEEIALARRLDEVAAAQQALAVASEFDAQYARGGGFGMNAFTTEDLTAFFVQLPADRLELWFWMESDRLSAPVFRDFYKERAVIRAERRQGLAADPRLRPLEQAAAALWADHRYGWPPMGLEDDFEALTRPAAQRFFERHYHPANIVAVVVGATDRAQVETLARRYFARLAPGADAGPTPTAPPDPASGERRVATGWTGGPLVHVAYRTAAAGASDAVSLDLLARALNNRFGAPGRDPVVAAPTRRLRAAYGAKRWGGSFAADLEAWDTASLGDVENWWQRTVERLAAEDLAAAELDRARNQLAADAYRRLEDPYLMLVEILMAAGRGDWRDPFTLAERAKAATPADLRRAAAAHLVPERRLIARWLPAGVP